MSCLLMLSLRKATGAVQRISDLSSCTDRCSSQFKNRYLTEMCSGSEAGLYLKLIDFRITQLQARE